MVARGWWMDGAECPRCHKTDCGEYETSYGSVFFCYSICDGCHEPRADVHACDTCSQCRKCCPRQTCNNCDGSICSTHEYAEYIDDIGTVCQECHDEYQANRESYAHDEPWNDEPCDCDECRPYMADPFASYDPSLGRTYEERVAHREEREQVQETWEQRFMTISPAQAMADFYVHHAMESMIMTARNAAGSSVYGADNEYTSALLAILDDDGYSELVDELDTVFQRYVTMAIGGEIRHHYTVTGLSSSRNHVFRDFPYIAAAMKKDGRSAAKVCADLFRDGTWSSAYGGELWAIAADVLAMREDGRLPAWAFVDRVWSLQHNGGSLLNKVTWAPHPRLVRDGYDPELDYYDSDREVGVICRQIGNAHHSDDIATLLALASPRVVSVYRRFVIALNKFRMSAGIPRDKVPQPTDNVTRHYDVLELKPRNASYYDTITLVR